MDRAPQLQRRRASLFEPIPETGDGAILRGAPLPRVTVDTDRESSGDTQTPVSATARATSRAAPMSSFTLPVPQPRTSAPVDSQEIAREFAPAENTATRVPGRERQAPLPVAHPLPAPRTAARAQVNGTPKTLTAQPPQALETIVEKIRVAPGPGLLSPGRSMAGSEKHTTTEYPAPAMQRTITVLGGQREKTAEIGVSHASAEKGAGVATRAQPAKPADPPVFIPPSRQARAATRPQPPVVHAAAPTINVTIGRIEVRATPAPSTPARATRRATSKTSLEDYLRSRSGGNK